MTKSNKIGLFINILLSILVILGIGIFFGLFVGSHVHENDMEAEVGEDKSNIVTEEVLVRVNQTAYAYGHDSCSSYGGGISIHDNNAYIRVCVVYDNTYFSGVTVHNVDADAGVNSRSWSWDDAAFTLTPQSGFSWKVGEGSSWSYYVNRSGDSSAYNDPVNFSNWNSDDSGWKSFKRSGNYWYYEDGFSGSGSGLRGSIHQGIKVNTLNEGVFNNWWNQGPWVSGCEYGQTPTWGGAAAYGTTKVEWYNSTRSRLSTVPTQGGSYYARIYSSGSGNVGSIYSDYLPFTITGGYWNDGAYYGNSGWMNNWGVKVWGQYESNYISSFSVENLSEGIGGGWISITRNYIWNPSALTVNPQSGLSWNANSYTFNINYSEDRAAFNDPMSYSGWRTTSLTWSRSGNVLTTDTVIINTTINSIGNNNKFQTAFINFVNIKFFSNSWAVNPSIASWTYGQTAANPQGVATYSGTTTYTYYDANKNQLSGKPSTPGTYYMTCYDTGVGNVSAIGSGYVQFKIYAPTPVLNPTIYDWCNANINASYSIDGTYVNVPSGITAKNVGSYTATFTTKSGYTFNNDSTSYSIGWSIRKLTLAIPFVSGEFTYDGSAKPPSGTNIVFDMNSTYITQGGTASATNAGTYTVTFTLKYPEGCQWSDGTQTQKSGTWTIARAAIATKPTLKDSGQYTFSNADVNILNHVNNYNSNYMTVGGTSTAKNAGSYSVTFTVKDNYWWNDGSAINNNNKTVTISWSITKMNLTKPSISANPTYDGSSTNSPQSPTIINFDSNIMNKTGDLSAENVKTSGNYSITISLKDTANYQWSDGTTGNLTLTWNILPRDLSGATITFPNNDQTEFTYDGTAKTPDPTVTTTLP